MSLTLNETFRVAASPDRVWQFLRNPAEVVTCLPGAELTETIDERNYGGRVKVKVGPITAAYTGKATLTEVDDSTRQMQILGEGKESGGAGSARMTLRGSVAALPDGASEVTVDATIDIAGRVMQFGRGLIESVNRQLFKQFAESVQAKLAAATESDDGPPAAPPVDAPSAVGVANADHAGHELSAVVRPKESPAGGAPRTAPAAVPPTPAPHSASPRPASGNELRALALLWKVFTEWLRGLFGVRR